MKPGARILIVEDEGLIAMLLEDMLGDLGFDVAGTASTLAAACEMAGEIELDAAILDLSLHGQKSFPVADLLEKRGIPYLFASGYGPQGLDSAYAGRKVLRKPFQLEDLDQALRSLQV